MIINTVSFFIHLLSDANYSISPS